MPENPVTLALAALPAAYREGTRVTPQPDDGHVRIAFPIVHATPEQRAAVEESATGSVSPRRAAELIQDLGATAREVAAACMSALRASGWDVAPVDRHDNWTADGYPFQFTVSDAIAVRTPWGSPASPEGGAYELGVDHGWDHANFVDAYGKEHDRRTPDIPGRYAQRHTALAYEQGWREGRKRYRRNLYADGTPIPA